MKTHVQHGCLAVLRSVLSACVVLGTGAGHAATGMTPGGLTAYPVIGLGPNLLTNGSFESVNPTTGKPANWTGSLAFSLDATVAKSGTQSFRMKDAPLFPYGESAPQTVALKKGSYRIGGWVKMEGLAATRGNGVRLCLSAPPSYPWALGRGCTAAVKGTADWQYLEAKNIVITQDSTAGFSLEAYGEPDGTAWFDDVELREELAPPVEVFLLYPNYRGILFDDQSQSVRFDVTVTPPAGTDLAAYRVEFAITDETADTTVVERAFTPFRNFLAEFDLSFLDVGRTYLAGFRLIRTADSTAISEYPAYRISKVSGTSKLSMRVAFDEQNRFLLHGTPGFILGVYDSGLGYGTSVGWWENLFSSQRRLFELPINFYLNYWYGGAPASAMTSMMDDLQTHGISYLQTGNCFAGSFDQSFLIYTSDTSLSALAAHPGLAGFYTADECQSFLAPQVFEKYQRLKAFQPDGATLGVFNQPANLSFWRDTVDVLATDPYPLYGAVPVGGYRLSLVADWARQTREAVKGSRPFVTVLQFFQFTSLGRWPTTTELRNMSYMAIAEGANGLFYWSLGANALAYVCTPSTDWCAARVDYFERLKTVLNELKGLEPALIGVDRPDLLTGNSNPAAIRTRIKFADGKAYLIAYNYTNSPQAVTFTWAEIPTWISVYNEARTLTPSGSDFTDTFDPYQAHVYAITGNTLHSPQSTKLPKGRRGWKTVAPAHQ